MGVEYRILKADRPLSTAQCNELGAEGWEMVWGYRDPQGQWFFYFKKVTQG